jgi:hypothetical protein
MKDAHEIASLAADFLSDCHGQIFNPLIPLSTLQNDSEFADMVSIGRAIQWEREAEWRDWCHETPERARFYGDA